MTDAGLFDREDYLPTVATHKPKADCRRPRNREHAVERPKGSAGALDTRNLVFTQLAFQPHVVQGLPYLLRRPSELQQLRVGPLHVVCLL